MKKLLLVILAVLMLSGCGTESKIDKFVKACQDSGGVSTVRDAKGTFFPATIFLACEPLTPPTNE